MARRRRVVGVLLILIGVVMTGAGVVDLLSGEPRLFFGGPRPDAVGMDCERPDGRPATGAVAVAGGIYAGAVGLRVYLSARRRRKLNRLRRALLGGGCLFVLAGLAVSTFYDSVVGFAVGCCLQAAGAVTVALGTNATDPEPDLPSPYRPGGH